MNKRIRNYAGNDAYLFEQCAVLHSMFVEQLEVFKKFDATLNENFANQWMEATNAAMHVGSDNFYLPEIRSKLTSLTDLQEQAKLKWKEMKFFTEKTFPNNKTVLAEFGSKSYLEASRKPELMVHFLDTLYLTAVKYKLELKLQGANTVKINSIKTLKNKLQVALSEYENTKRNRAIHSDRRVKLCNDCYAMLMRVSKAAQIVYYDNEVRKKTFVYDKRRKKRKVEVGNIETIDQNDE